jgi:hypothetical protein
MALQVRRDSWVRLGLAGALLAALTACGRSGPAPGQQADSTAADSTVAASADFRKRVDDYVALHNQLSAKMGAIDETKSQAEIAARAATLAHLIAAARAGAKQGDIFTPAVAARFMALIKQEYAARPDSIKNTREDQEDEHRSDGLPDFAPRVDSLFPTAYPLPTFPPALLPLLPPLPKEVEYRIVAHHLILRDIDANLIVDFIPNVVP